MTTKDNTAIVTRVSWKGEGDKRVFVVTLVYANGPPDLPPGVLFRAVPVRIVAAEPEGPK